MITPNRDLLERVDVVILILVLDQMRDNDLMDFLNFLLLNVY